MTNSLSAAHDSILSPRPALEAPELLAGEPANEPFPTTPDGPALVRALLADRAMLRTLRTWVCRGVPAEEVEGLVQTVCVEALSATRVPANPDELRPWLHGLCRHVRSDALTALGKQNRRFSSLAELAEEEEDSDDDRAPVAEPEDPRVCPPSARDRLRWVERRVERGELPREVLGAMVRDELGERLHPRGSKAAAAERSRVAYHRSKLRAAWKQACRDETYEDPGELAGRVRPKPSRR